MNQLDPDCRYRGLEHTPLWRWLIYVLLFTLTVAYCGLKFDRMLLFAVPISGVFMVNIVIGMDRLFKNPKGRAWLLRNLKWLILIFIVGKIVLFIWDRFEERNDIQNSSTMCPSEPPSSVRLT